MASSRGTTWFTVLNIQMIGALTSDLHQVITAAGFPRSNLQAICKHFEWSPNLRWTCESNQLWWKSAYLPAAADKTNKCAMTFFIIIFHYAATFESMWCNGPVSNHHPCFSDTTPESPAATGCRDAISGRSCMGLCPFLARSVNPAVAMCRCEVLLSLPHQGALHLIQPFWPKEKRRAKPQHKWGFRDKGLFFLV